MTPTVKPARKTMRLAYPASAALRENLELLMERNGDSRNALAKYLKIDVTTLRRRLEDPTEFRMGEYHYHHGYPAHQHENGVCPYDFNELTTKSISTGSSSSGSGGSVTRSSWSSTKPSKDHSGLIVTAGVIGLFLSSITVGFVKERLHERKIKKKKKIRQAALDIVSGYLTPEMQSRSQLLFTAIEESTWKMEPKRGESINSMAHRVLNRACYSYLLFCFKHKDLDETQILPQKLVVKIFQDSLFWLYHSNFYTKEQHDDLVRQVNSQFSRFNPSHKQ